MTGRYKKYTEAEDPSKPVNGAIWDNTRFALLDTKEVYKIELVGQRFVTVIDKSCKLENGKIVRISGGN
jgi:hypothetical protein